MLVVGAVALDVIRVPGASAVTLACDLSSAAVQVVRAAAGRLGRVAGWAVGEAVSALRTRGSDVAAFVTSFRVPTPWLAVVAYPAAGGPAPAGAPANPRAARTQSPGARRRELVLPADPTAPGLARAFLRRVAQEWGVDDDLVQDAAMVVTELVANAVDHARSGSTLFVGVDRGRLGVAVHDTRPGTVPRPAPIDPTAPRGRGLQMVDALASSWGVTPHGEGKVVWAVLG